jgi:hypothetical protein
MRQEVEDLQELGKLLDRSPRKYFYSPRLHTIAAQHPQPTPSGSDAYKYHTPPSNRKGRVLSDDSGDEIMNIRARLRRMRSTETNRSVASLPHHHQQHGGESSGVRRNKSAQSKSSKVGFRELEVARGDFDASPSHDAAGIVQQRTSRFEGLSAASARRKMRSSERWFGVRRESRERERDEKQKMMANWI